jgi:small ligand-binding sensory domain FIST
MSHVTPVPTDVKAPRAACAVSSHMDTRTAATEIAHALHDSLGEGCDAMFIFASYHHRAALEPGAQLIRAALRPTFTLGVTAESVLGFDQELEGVAGLAALGLRMPPGTRLHPWSFIHGRTLLNFDDAAAMRGHLGVGDDTRAVLMLADPFSTPMQQLLPAIGACRAPRPVPVIGGMASGASQPGHNLMIQGELAVPAGAVGLTISGPVAVDLVVSQGCRPVGQAMVITKVKNNVILEIGGRKALEVIQEMAQALPERERPLLAKGLFAGLVTNEYKDRFGRGDFLVRNILAADKGAGSIAVGDVPRVGQTIQFHVRDAETAEEDLQLLLDAQELKDPPFAGLLFTCNGRGTRLFAKPNHDVNVIRQRLGSLPLAGFFAAGEIGPIGDRSFVHGQTASLALFRGG